MELSDFQDSDVGNRIDDFSPEYLSEEQNCPLTPR